MTIGDACRPLPLGLKGEARGPQLAVLALAYQDLFLVLAQACYADLASPFSFRLRLRHCVSPESGARIPAEWAFEATSPGLRAQMKQSQTYPRRVRLQGVLLCL